MKKAQNKNPKDNLMTHIGKKKNTRNNQIQKLMSGKEKTI